MIAEEYKIMKITTVEQKHKNPAFGYNQGLNKEVIKTLSQIPSDLNKKLLQLNVLCNKTEDLIDFQNKNNILKAEKNPLINLFLNIKMALTSELDYHFPSLKYSEIESTHYAKENNIEIENWKLEISKLIKPEQDEITKNLDQTFLLFHIKPNESSPKGIESIPGRANLKQEILDKIINPLKNPDNAKLIESNYGIKTPKSILLTGPDGCNKGLIAEAIAREADLPYYKINIDHTNINPNEGNITQPEAIIEILSNISKKDGKPCVLNLYGFNNLFPKKNSEEYLLPQSERNIERLMETIKNTKDIIIISTIEKLDQGSRIDSIVKHGFDSLLEVGLPDKQAIITNLKHDLEPKQKGQELFNSEKDLSIIADTIKKIGFTDKDIKILSNDAALIAKEKSMEISKQHYLEAIKQASDLISSKQTRRVIGFSD